MQKQRLPWLGVALCGAAVAVAGTAFWYSTRPVIPRIPVLDYEVARSGHYLKSQDSCNPAEIRAIRPDRKRLEKAESCAKDAENYRVSTNDLIQQTRAANAAEAQASIAGQALAQAHYQTLVGALTLVAAVLAALYAGGAAKYARKSFLTADAQYIVSNRPIVRVRFGWLEGGPNNGTSTTAAITVANVGGEMATVIEFSIDIKISDASGRLPIPLQYAAPEHPGLDLRGGQSDELFSQMITMFTSDQIWHDLTSGKKQAYCFGYIAYQDKNGISRKTGFFRRPEFHRTPEGRGAQYQMMRTDDEWCKEYEYED